MKRNPLTIVETSALNGDNISVVGEDALENMLRIMNGLSNQERVVAFQVLGDYFCCWCGVEQPPGDCQCRTTHK